MVPSQHSALRGAFEWVAVIAIALVATFLIRTFVVEPFVVPTGSMEDTIEIGDQILAQKVSLELGQPVKQGDIVVKTIRLADGYQNTITLTAGDITNVIEVDGKSVRFASSNCPDQVCVHTGTPIRAGQMAVCLPTRVVVRLIGEDTTVDAVAR